MARGYVDRQINKELPRLARRARRQWEHLDFDRDVLGRAGLMRRSHAPGWGTALGLIALGGVAGSLLALLWAPKAGSQTRNEVRQRAQELMGQGKSRMQEHQPRSTIQA
jgi:hypothetical protein